MTNAKVKYPNASTEPLDVIEANECGHDWQLATLRFERCFNEIESLNNQIAELKAELEIHARSSDGLAVSMAKKGWGWLGEVDESPFRESNSEAAADEYLQAEGEAHRDYFEEQIAKGDDNV